MSEKIVRGGLYVAFLRLIYILLELGAVILLARVLGASSYGVFAFMYALVKIATIPAQAGIPTLLTREIPKYIFHEAWGKIKGIIIRSTQMAFLASAAGGAIILYAVYFYLDKGIADPKIYFFAFLLVPVFAMSNVRGGAIRGLGRVALSQLPESIIRPGVFLLGVCLILFWPGLDVSINNTMIMLLAASIISAVMGGLMLVRYLPKKIKISDKEYEDRKWIASLLPLSILSGIQILNGQIGIVYLGIYSSNEDVGIYRVLFQVGQMVMFALTVITMTISPTISKLHTSGQRQDLEALIRKSSLATTVFSIFCCLAFILIGEWMLGAVFGAQFSAGYLAGVIICSGQVINALTGPAAALLNMSGKERKTIKALSFSLFSSVVLHAVLVPSCGIMGAAIAFSVSLFVLNFFLCVYAKKELSINPLPYTAIVRKHG